MRANPKSHSLTCGNSAFEESRTFSGLRSQWTIFLLCKCLRATRICVGEDTIRFRESQQNGENKNLGDEELCDALRQSSLFTWENHLQHVAFQFFHDDKNAFGRFEHAFQIDNTRVRQILKDRHFVFQLVRLFSREAHLIDHLDSHRPVGLTVGSWKPKRSRWKVMETIRKNKSTSLSIAYLHRQRQTGRIQVPRRERFDRAVRYLSRFPAPYLHCYPRQLVLQTIVRQ